MDHIKFDLELAVEQQLGAQPLPFPGMDSACGLPLPPARGARGWLSSPVPGAARGAGAALGHAPGGSPGLAEGAGEGGRGVSEGLSASLSSYP